MSPAIDRAYDRGIPVIVFERKTDSQKYTSFVSADNYEMGRVMGEYIASCLGGAGRVLEVMGLKGSSPADERHRGFREAIDRYPQISVVATLQGDWTEETAYEAVRQYIDELRLMTDEYNEYSSINNHQSSINIDCVFGHNDRTAMRARKALLGTTPSEDAKGTTPLFCGIDGLPGENGGICQVRDSLLNASYIYPTRGDLLLQLALDILEGRPYEKEVMLTSALVTPENANVLLLESDGVMRRSQKLERLQTKADSYLQRINQQRLLNALALGVIVLLLVAIALFYLYHLSKVNMQRERVVQNLWNMESPTPDPTTHPYSPSQPSSPLPLKGESGHLLTAEGIATSRIHSTLPHEGERGEGLPTFITRFREVVEKRMADSELSVEDIAADMNLSRVQLYRKVKALSGSSPVELLRTARLNRGYQLLLTTDKTVSEVAYAVGFSAPAYFTKCFKDEFGMVPGDVRK